MQNETNMITYKLTGNDAIRISERESLTLHCYGNPIDRGGVVSNGLARQIAKEDPALIYVIVTPSGSWRDSQGNYTEAAGRNAHDYFAHSGEYLGPDDDGIEPGFSDAP